MICMIQVSTLYFHAHTEIYLAQTRDGWEKKFLGTEANKSDLLREKQWKGPSSEPTRQPTSHCDSQGTIARCLSFSLLVRSPPERGKRQEKENVTLHLWMPRESLWLTRHNQQNQVWLMLLLLLRKKWSSSFADSCMCSNGLSLLCCCVGLKNLCGLAEPN